ncbi:hypothetical protein SS50377_21277 [Spironucleus salmonicida]|uniref:Uncharacterized protein n=2 Tax=Spironucleus salmonicida TaxID=348837 RepID=A0A9P8M0Q0_9EUKA|nr:hypothetical protein SS50377_21277 [Spironucleus salmonicida]
MDYILNTRLVNSFLIKFKQVSFKTDIRNNFSQKYTHQQIFFYNMQLQFKNINLLLLEKSYFEMIQLTIAFQLGISQLLKISIDQEISSIIKNPNLFINAIVVNDNILQNELLLHNKLKKKIQNQQDIQFFIDIVQQQFQLIKIPVIRFHLYKKEHIDKIIETSSISRKDQNYETIKYFLCPHYNVQHTIQILYYYFMTQNAVVANKFSKDYLDFYNDMKFKQNFIIKNSDYLLHQILPSLGNGAIIQQFILNGSNISKCNIFRLKEQSPNMTQFISIPIISQDQLIVLVVEGISIQDKVKDFTTVLGEQPLKFYIDYYSNWFKDQQLIVKNHVYYKFPNVLPAIDTFNKIDLQLQKLLQIVQFDSINNEYRKLKQLSQLIDQPMYTLYQQIIDRNNLLQFFMKTQMELYLFYDVDLKLFVPRSVSIVQYLMSEQKLRHSFIDQVSSIQFQEQKLISLLETKLLNINEYISCGYDVFKAKLNILLHQE